MQAQASPKQAHTFVAWLLAAFGVALMLLLLLSFLAKPQPAPATELAGATSPSVAYLQFGTAEDTLYLAGPASPADRRALLVIPHAAEYGILPRLSPAGDRFAFTALPPGLAYPRPDSPADLWVAPFDGSSPQRITQGVDLLVTPLWSQDGASLVYRRSTRDAHLLALAPVAGGEERILTNSETRSLFPLAFAPGGDSLYFVALSETTGSDLYSIDLATGVETAVTTLSTGLTRDWTLSPDGHRIAYLEVALSEAAVLSRAVVLDLESAARTPLTDADTLAFGLVWSADSQLAIGAYHAEAGSAAVLVVDGASRTHLPGPDAGFDVPLAYDAQAGGYLVRSFRNGTPTSPGPSELVLVRPGGERTIIAEGEVTLVGWTHQ